MSNSSRANINFHNGFRFLAKSDMYFLSKILERREAAVRRRHRYDLALYTRAILEITRWPQGVNGNVTIRDFAST